MLRVPDNKDLFSVLGEEEEKKYKLLFARRYEDPLC